jgi:hypothetical protein
MKLDKKQLQWYEELLKIKESNAKQNKEVLKDTPCAYNKEYICAIEYI